jgi:hypothetical protein
MEFDEVREYLPGDDVRAIDWNVTARTGHPYVKRFVEERELTVMLAVDVSASHALRQPARLKRTSSPSWPRCWRSPPTCRRARATATCCASSARSSITRRKGGHQHSRWRSITSTRSRAGAA